MAKTDLAEVRDHVRVAVRDNVRPAASAALDTVKAQAASAGETLATRAGTALDTASEQSRRARKKAAKRAAELAEQAAKTARKSAKKSAKTARKRADKAGKKAHKRARELNVVLQEKAGRKHPRRGRRVVMLGGLALGGIAVVTMVRRRQADAAQAEQFAPSPTADTGSGLPGDPGPSH